jgi:hypothetical protein
MRFSEGRTLAHMMSRSIPIIIASGLPTNAKNRGLEYSFNNRGIRLIGENSREVRLASIFGGASTYCGIREESQ